MLAGASGTGRPGREPARTEGRRVIGSKYRLLASDSVNPEGRTVRSRQIWVDADACPKAIKEILFRAADRTGVTVTLVANKLLHVPRSRHIRSIRVASGFDITDNHIVQQVEEGDLVITADIPLAAEVIAKGCVALNPRGELYTDDNIRERLNMRDFMDVLRGSGVDTGGPNSFGQADRQAFANQLDRLLAK